MEQFSPRAHSDSLALSLFGSDINMLSSEQEREYLEKGYLRLPSAFAAPQVAAIMDRVWGFLEDERGVRRDDPESWDISGAWQGLKNLKKEPLFQSLHSEELCAAIDQLIGEGNWQRPRHWGGFMVNFPDCKPEDWHVPARGWHVDFHFTYEPGSTFGIRAFTVLAHLPPRAGGTLHLLGSHRLVERFVRGLSLVERKKGYAKLVADFNRSHPWVEKLCNGDAADPRRVSQFMAEGLKIEGVELRVEQVTGEAGDVVLAHPWLLHTGSPNAGPVPRFMIAKTIYAQSCQPEPSQA